MRRFDGAKALSSSAQPRKSGERHVRERNHSFTSSRLGRANRQSSSEQVHVAPLQPLQLAASCRRIQAKDRSQVSRFPFRPHYSRFEKPLLFFLSYRPPDGARLSEWPYVVSNTRPELRSLQDAAQDAQLCVESGRTNFLFRSPSPVIGNPLNRDGFERFLFEVGSQLHQELFFFRLTRGCQFQLPSGHVLVRSLCKWQASESCGVVRQLSFGGFSDELFFLGLCFSPVRRAKRLAEALPVDNEMCSATSYRVL